MGLAASLKRSGSIALGMDWISEKEPGFGWNHPRDRSQFGFAEARGLVWTMRVDGPDDGFDSV